ncbi:MAG: hypothetical protein CL801_07750 [Citromicrobium sp.]|nr:hypothetical protein [Citromicrobium sp.]
MYRSLTTSLLAVGAATISTAAYAQTAPETTYTFDLPAQPMDDALTSVAERTGSNVVYNGQDVADRRAPAIRGTLTAQAAFERILAGSGLVLRRTGSGAFVVSSPTQQSATTGRSAISGSVTAANSTRGLEGALVRIVETGQTTAVDSFGDFRFAKVPAGTYTLATKPPTRASASAARRPATWPSCSASRIRRAMRSWSMARAVPGPTP